MHKHWMLRIAIAGIALAGCNDDGETSTDEPLSLSASVNVSTPLVGVSLSTALSLSLPALPTIPTSPQVLPTNAPGASSSLQLPITNATYDAKLLIISADGTEPSLTWIRQAADYIGVPYTLYVATATPGGFAPSMLSDGNSHGYYQGIVMTTGSLAYYDGTAWSSAFTPAEWQTLWDYQAAFKVRTAISYVFPTADFGYGAATAVNTTTSPIAATLSTAGASVFRDVNSANPLTIAKAYTYLAAPAGTGNSVLLGDAAGHALALIHTYADGRTVLSMTFDGNCYLTHSLALAYGTVRWASGGLFLGERHAYVTPQIDDLFISDDSYGSSTTYRLNALDWAAVQQWQTTKQLDSTTAKLQLHWAYVGAGTRMYFPDTLTPAAATTQSQFEWINHTYSHANLDSATYSSAYSEITNNQAAAAQLGFTNFDRSVMVTPDISGLSNAAAMTAAYDAGIRVVVTDTSRPEMDNPTPQAGIANWNVPAILMIPRRPVNLFYNVSTPAEWTAEYNALYRGYWGRDLSYREVLDTVSDVLLPYVMRGENDPWMFHQPNLRAYDGVHTLLGDLLDRLFVKYRAVLVRPVLSPSLSQLGEIVRQRMRVNAADVRASFVPGKTITVSAAHDAVVPITGLCTASSENYNGECITYANVPGGQSITFNLQ